MELNLAQLRAVTLGALDVQEVPGGFRFMRMTPTQTAAFARAGLESALPVLEGCSGNESVRILVESACVVSSFSRLLAEKLLLPEENS